MSFPIDGPLERSLYLQPFWDCALSVLGSRVWPFRVTWRHRDHLIALWNQASISNGLRDIQWRMWRIGWRDLKGPL